MNFKKQPIPIPVYKETIFSKTLQFLNLKEEKNFLKFLGKELKCKIFTIDGNHQKTEKDYESKKERKRAKRNILNKKKNPL